MKQAIVYGHIGIHFGVLGVIFVLWGLGVAPSQGGSLGVFPLAALAAWTLGIVFLLAESVAFDLPDRAPRTGP